MDAFGLAGIVIVEEQLRILGQEGLPSFVIAVCRTAGGADNLFWRNAVSLFRVLTHEVLSPTGDNVSLVTIGAQVSQQFLHRLVGQLRVRALPARIFPFA